MRRAPLVAALLWVAAAVTTSLGAANGAASKPIGFSILEDYEKGEDLAGVARDFALFRELGITTWRGSFAWDHYEPARGKYDFAWLEQFADLAAAQGITLRPYIGYTPQWASSGGHDADAWNDPPRNLDDWSRFVRALATAMKRHPNVVSFEIYNEENVQQWWEGTPAAYNAVLRRAFDAIEAVNPRLQVVFGGMVYPDARWIAYACTQAHNAGRFQVLPFHAYPETWTPPDVDLEHYLGDHFADGFVRSADADCGRKPIWINETGFATVDGKTERDQAEWWARAVPTFFAAPRVEHIGVYEIKDLRPDREAIGGTANYHLGITRVDRSKKLAFGTVQRLVSLFAGGRVAVLDSDLRLAVNGAAGAAIYRHLFGTEDGRQLLFVWDKSEPVTVDATLPRRGRSAVEYRVDSSRSPVPAFDGTTLPRIALRPGDVRIFEITP